MDGLFYAFFFTQQYVIQYLGNAPKTTRNFWLQILRTKGGS